jgi:hypothetical protein
MGWTEMPNLASAHDREAIAECYRQAAGRASSCLDEAIEYGGGRY